MKEKVEREDLHKRSCAWKNKDADTAVPNFRIL